MQFVDAQTFNGLFSAHAALMIFLFMIPVFAGIANYVLPLMIGAPDMAFPRLNALSFWMLPIAGVMMCLSFLVPGGAFATGWTAYAPLSTEAPIGQTFFTIGVQFAGASSIATALNFLVTIITMRAPGMTFWRMPLLVWANFSTSLLVVIATPFIAASQFMILLDRALGLNFFDAAQGGDVLMYQHVFWFYSHPAVYIMMLPGFGIISEVISDACPKTGLRLPHDGVLAAGDRRARLHRLGAPHVRRAHAELDPHPDDDHHHADRRPDGSQDLLLARNDVARCAPHANADAIGRFGFLTMFMLGGISGVMLAMVPFDIHVSDTYFIVAHIHYVLFGGSLFTIFAGIYHWFPKMTGRMYNETLGKWHFWLTFIFFNVTFGPMHLIGLEGMPRRVADYAEQFAAWNMFISISSFVLGVSTLIFLYNMITPGAAARSPRPTRGTRTRSSGRSARPPPIFNFDEVPTVVGGPYEYGVPGALHGIFKEPEPVVATVGAPPRSPQPSLHRPPMKLQPQTETHSDGSPRSARQTTATCRSPTIRRTSTANGSEWSSSSPRS